MKNPAYLSDAQTLRLIYIDNNLLKRLFKHEGFWDSFFDNFKASEAWIFEDGFDMLFTWCQFIEFIGIRNVLINTSNIMKVHDIKKMNLHEYFELIKNIILQLPQLQKTELLAKIEDEIKGCGQHAALLIQKTLFKVKKFIETNDDYIESLSFELSWAYITSNPPFDPKGHSKKIDPYFKALLNEWHKMFCARYEYNLFRLFVKWDESKRFTNPNSNKNLISNQLLKPLRDLCDSELIHFSFIGSDNQKVISITADPLADIEMRYDYFGKKLLDIQHNTDLDWNVILVSGEIFWAERIGDQITKIKKLCPL